MTERHPMLTPSAERALRFMRETKQRLIVSRHTHLADPEPTVNAMTAAALSRAGVAYTYQALDRLGELRRFLAVSP